ncbi:MAG: deoxyribonuclease V [Anaerolineae bacterium]
MKIPDRLNMSLTPQAAIAQQRDLAVQVVEQNEFGPIHYVAGVDVGFEEDKTLSRAAAVVLSFPDLAPVESGVARRPVTFPYIPGLLAYREIPVVLDALAQLTTEPDVIIVDGHGRAHPRRFGIACQLGVLLDRASIGCGKSILVGQAQEPENRIGAWTPLVDKGAVIGAAVRTKLNVKPVYVSIGNKIDLPTAVDIVLRCTTRYRVPETTRYAHNVAGGATLTSGSPLKLL